jgi:predicted ATPase
MPSLADAVEKVPNGFAANFSPKDETRDDCSSICWEPELHTVRGELMSMIGNRAAAEEAFHRSLTISRNVSAKLIELRASTRLASLWRDQGKRTEARDLLAPIYSWFTEGFDTLDLKEAKALLGEFAQ